MPDMAGALPANCYGVGGVYIGFPLMVKSRDLGKSQGLAYRLEFSSKGTEALIPGLETTGNGVKCSVQVHQWDVP
jgi:hypothetical protein